MADYYPLIARAVANLSQNTETGRRALYARARDALVAQLRGRSEAEVLREQRLLNEAIRKVETETNADLRRAATRPAAFLSEFPQTAARNNSSVAKDGGVGRGRGVPIAAGLLATTLVIVIGLLAVLGVHSPAISPPPKPLAAGTAVTAASAAQNADTMVPMRSDVTCQLHGVSYLSTVGPGGTLTSTAGSLNKLLCAYSGEASRDVPLAGGKIENGIIKTKDFGNIRIDFENSLTSNGFSMYMRSADQDKLAAVLRHQMSSVSPPKSETTTALTQSDIGFETPSTEPPRIMSPVDDGGILRSGPGGLMLGAQYFECDPENKKMGLAKGPFAQQIYGNTLIDSSRLKQNKRIGFGMLISSENDDNGCAWTGVSFEAHTKAFIASNYVVSSVETGQTPPATPTAYSAIVVFDPSDGNKYLTGTLEVSRNGASLVRLDLNYPASKIPTKIDNLLLQDTGYPVVEISDIQRAKDSITWNIEQDGKVTHKGAFGFPVVGTAPKLVYYVVKAAKHRAQ